MTAKEHYDNHLGHFYSWMMGDLQQKQEEHQKFFLDLGLAPLTTRRAIDLGCGHGIQSIALAHLGFRVAAVDFNAELLNELFVAKGDLAISLYKEDLLQFLRESNENVDVITCMGDTLTHLESPEEVSELIGLCSQRLVPGGKLVLSFRDLSEELKKENRFILVKSDDHRILSCFLEYVDDKVIVYDMLWQKEDSGWKQKVSFY